VPVEGGRRSPGDGLFEGRRDAFAGRGEASSSVSQLQRSGDLGSVVNAREYWSTICPN
jgi:hypothetical protein